MARAADQSTPQSPFDALPFFAGRPRGQSRGLSPRHFWTVKPTGDFGNDCKTGQEYALLYLAAEEAADDSGSLLPSIVADMPREPEFGGIEVGFLQMIGFAAIDGAPRARQIASYWKRSMADLEARQAEKAMRPAPVAKKRKNTKKP